MKKLYILGIAFVSICSMLFGGIIYAGLTNTWTNPMELLASSGSNLSSENWNKVLSNQSILSEKIENLGGKNYSTEETFTGDYWIDGKKIYMKVVPFSVAITITNSRVDSGIKVFDNLDNIVDGRIVRCVPDHNLFFPVLLNSDINFSGERFFIASPMSLEIKNLPLYGISISDYKLVVKYTKKSE